MDEGDEGGFGDGGDRNDQFHRNEAISAVADDGFLGEEEDDDDYEDLYNDVNVSEGFLQSMRRNEDSGFRKEEEEEKKKKIDSAAESAVVSIPGVAGGCGGGGGGGGGEEKFAQNDGGFQGISRVPGRLDGFQDIGFKENESASKGSGVGLGFGSGMRVELGQSSGKIAEMERQTVNSSTPSQGIAQQQSHVVGARNVGNEGFVRQGGGAGGEHVNGIGGNRSGGGGAVSGGGGTILFVGDLHWWTTDEQLEAELCKYGAVKEVRFFDEKASGKSKGYCQVEFYDPAAATACKEGMNGHVFNGRPCVVANASPYSVKRMGEAQVNKNQQMGQTTFPQGRRGMNDAGGRGSGSNITAGGNYQGGDGGRNYGSGGNYQGGDGGRNYGSVGNYQGGDGGRNYGRGNWGRGGNPGMGNRGAMRNRMGGMGGRGIIGNGGSGFGQGLAAAPPLLHPQTMMGQGFDPTYGTHMGRMGGYGGFPTAPTPPFSGILPSYAPVGGMGLPGVAPHVNPAFFGRGIPATGMGVMPVTGVEGHGMGMWSDPNAAGWGSEEHGGRVGESSYGDDAASDHQYGEVSHERGRPSAVKEKDRPSEQDWSGASDRRYRDDREPVSNRGVQRDKNVDHDHHWSESRYHDDREIGRDRERDRDRDRDRYREDKDRYSDHHRYRDREADHDDEWDRGRSSRTQSKSRISQEEDQNSRSRDAEYGKRRRRSSE